MLQSAKLFTGKTTPKRTGRSTAFNTKAVTARARKAPVKPPIVWQTPITPKVFIQAVKGSRGLQTEIARRIGCSWLTVHNVLLGKHGKGPQWDRARRAYGEEVECVGDLAEGTIHDAMEQRLDIATASRTAIAFAKMKLKSRGFVDETKTVIEGSLNHTHTIVPIEKLDLSLETRKALLEAIEKWEKTEKNEEGE